MSVGHANDDTVTSQGHLTGEVLPDLAIRFVPELTLGLLDNAQARTAARVVARSEVRIIELRVIVSMGMPYALANIVRAELSLWT